MTLYNSFGQPIGEAVENKLVAFPQVGYLVGQSVIVEALSAEKHTCDLMTVYGIQENPLENWTYLLDEPVHTREELEFRISQMLADKSKHYIVIKDKKSSHVW